MVLGDVGILSLLFPLYDKVVLYIMKNQRGIVKDHPRPFAGPGRKARLLGNHRGV